MGYVFTAVYMVNTIVLEKDVYDGLFAMGGESAFLDQSVGSFV